MKKPQTVWVKNNGSKTFRDRYDGEDFEIKPGEAVEMLVECATLCIGFGEEDKTRVLRRNGWASTKADIAAGTKRLNDFSFHLTEAEAHAKAETHRSAAPAVAEPSAGVQAPVGDAPSGSRKPGPLEKLAAANATAG